MPVGWGFALHQTPVILPLLELKTIPSLSFLAFPSSEVRTPFCSLQLLWDSESGPQTAWLIIPPRGGQHFSLYFLIRKENELGARSFGLHYKADSLYK